VLIDFAYVADRGGLIIRLYVTCKPQLNNYPDKMKIKNIILKYINAKNEDEFEPYYVYDTQNIRKHCELFNNILYQNKSIHIASMANTNPQFLEIVKEEKVNIFVNSLLHLEVAKSIGFREQEIIFTASALSKKAMRIVENEGIQLNVDSSGQLAQWLQLFPNKAVGIRCNIGDNVRPYSNHAGAFIGKESRIGLTREEIAQITDKSIIKGLHLYVGTDIFDIDYLIDCYRELVDLTSEFPNIEYLDFGGGFGVSENGDLQFNFPEYSARLTKLMHDASLKTGKSLKLILEPGRIIGGESGYFVCNVTDVKKRPDRYLIGVNASTVQFPRPLLYPETANHPVEIIRDGVQLMSDQKFRNIIYGCSTYSRDIFSNSILLPEVRVGDKVIFGNAGSYCASSHLEFLGFPKTEEFFI
jgi:diaminopimelate decarboxylase